MNQKISNSFFAREESPFGEGFSIAELVQNMKKEGFP